MRTIFLIVLENKSVKMSLYRWIPNSSVNVDS